MDTSIMFPSIENAVAVDKIGHPAVIKVIGVGGGGSNAVDRMIQTGVYGVEFTAVNTDLPPLRASLADTKIQIGETVSEGNGVGGDPELGRKSAEENIEGLKDAVKGADMLFVTTGMGGGTGTGAAPVIAQIAREMNILTVGVVTKPFEFEGPVRMRRAEEGIANLGKYADTLIVIPNERVFNVLDLSPSKELFSVIDDVLRQSIQSITDIITKKGVINRDLADVRSILSNAGAALIGMGEGADIKEAFNKALTNPLLDNLNISKITKMIVNLTAGKDYDFADALKRMTDIIKNAKMRKPDVIPGYVIDDNMGERIKATIVAAGFNSPYRDNFSKISAQPSKTHIQFQNQDSNIPAGSGELSFGDQLETPAAEYFLKTAYDHWQPRKLNK
ncbi:MAG: cell division protein FtsZ [Elusimicrobiota bacterium]|jgi:cell division protein FtsZ|nr:cell division protein FtsZ [Elusimicrobiota bacterium]